MGRLDPEYTGKVKKSKDLADTEMDNFVDGKGGGMFGTNNLKSAGAGIGKALTKGFADKALGEGTGDLLVSAMGEGGFNPYVMAGAAILGVAKSRAEKKRQQKMGAARAESERAMGEQKKSDIYGQMAKSSRGSLGGAQRKRSVQI